MAAFNYERFWEMIEKARKKAGLSEAEAAKAAGFSRPTWYNYRSGKFSPRLRDLQGIAEALGFQFRSPLVSPAAKDVSDAGSTVRVNTDETGGFSLSDAATQVAAIMAALPDDQQDFILKVVVNAASIRGFHEPDAASSGAAAVRPNK